MNTASFKHFATSAVLAAALYGLSSTVASAALIQYADRATFEAQGQVAEKYGFESPWGPTGGIVCAMNPCTSPYTTHGVTYRDDSVIVRPGSSYLGRPLNPESNVIAYEFFNPLKGLTVGPYDMLGFDLGNLVFTNNSPVTYALTTNLGVYTNTVAVPNVNSRPLSMQFFGFIAGAGEVFKDFSFAAASGAAPVLDNVTLGTRVPEPASLALLGLGLAAVAARRRRPQV